MYFTNNCDIETFRNLQVILLLIYTFFFVFRKSRVKRAVRVAAISSKIADIPSDEFSWRKYGQKPIKGSPYPRYYHIFLHRRIVDHVGCVEVKDESRGIFLIICYF